MKSRFHVFLLSTLFLAFFTASAFAAPPVVVESKCASGGAYVEGGTGWGNSASKSNKTSCGNGSRSSKNANAYADFIPPVDMEGTYHIYVTWGSTTASNNGPNAEGVKVSIMDGLGTRDVMVNMRGHANCSGGNANELVYLGQGYFVPGAGHKVRVSNVATGQCYNGASKRYVTADAVLLEFVVPVPTLPQTWGHLKARYTE